MASKQFQHAGNNGISPRLYSFRFDSIDAAVQWQFIMLMALMVWQILCQQQKQEGTVTTRG